MRTKRNQLIAAAVAVVLVAVGALLVLSGGDGEAPTTTTAAPTTSTTTTSTTTTTVPLEPAPLTGVGLAEVPDRPALVVKIDNADYLARPQSGLAQADVVYEERVEGGVTRFAAVFHSTGAERVGPIRSGRTTDIGITAGLGEPLFAFSGANGGILSSIRRSTVVDVGYDAATSAYERRSDRRAPDNLYSSTAALWAAAPEATGRPAPLFSYRDAGSGAPAQGRAVAAVQIGFRGSASVPVRYDWDPDTATWLRTQNGTPHVDEADVRLAPANVIVQEVDYVNTGYYDIAGTPVPEAVLTGFGGGWALVDGRAVEITWGRDGLDQPTVWRTAEGEPLLLTPGATWIHLVSPGGVTLDP